MDFDTIQIDYEKEETVMIGRAADKIFTRVFIFLIMTVYFWIYTVAGLVVLGIGPAFRTVTEMHMDKQWD